MDESIFSNEHLMDLARWLKVISEPKRLLLLEKIFEGVQCNCELGDALHMAPNLISHHLGILRHAGLVEVERDPTDGRWIYYSINNHAMEDLKTIFGDFFNQERIQPRHLTCGPRMIGDVSLTLMALEE